MFTLDVRLADVTSMSGYTTRAQYEATKPEPSSFPGAGSYIAAALIPIIGAILGIVALAKNRIGPGLALIATSVVAVAVWAYVLALMA